MNQFIFLLDLIGIIAFAASGAMVAAKNKMDLFGGLVLAFVTGIGGGTVRDLLLDVPVFWLSQPHYLWACLAGFLIVTIALLRFGQAPKATINFVDAIGLAVFTILGAQKTLALDHNIAVAVIMGMLTGCGGGIIRDILANQVPSVLTRNRLYATASLSGALVFVSLLWISSILAMVAGFTACFAVRILALFRDWRLPLFPMKRQ